jgi:hypothetical protein
MRLPSLNTISLLASVGLVFLVAGTHAQPPKDQGEQDKQGVFIIKRPMRDFADLAFNQIETGKIDLNAPFRVVISGRLVAKNKSTVLADAKIEPVIQPENSDPAMVKLAQDAIMAVGDAGWFAYLNNLGSKKVVITVEQTEDTFYASIRADQPRASNARTAASGLQAMTALASNYAKGDEKIILSAMNVTSEAENVIIGWRLPLRAFQELLKRRIAESKTADTVVSGN